MSQVTIRRPLGELDLVELSSLLANVELALAYIGSMNFSFVRGWLHRRVMDSA